MLVIGSNNVNEYVHIFFYDKLQFAVELFIPFTTSITNNHPSWFNIMILNLKNQKSKAYKKSRNNLNYIAYSSLRRELTKTIKSSY